MTLKYSRQRESIMSFLKTRKDHPTADVVYMNEKKEFPNISLGTVYRNLTLLTELGEISRIQVGDGIDHFDADISPHYHFICRQCGAVIDLPNVNMDEKEESRLIISFSNGFSGIVEGHTTYFYGLCSNCLTAEKN